MNNMTSTGTLHIFEEKLNTITHGIGTVLCIPAFIFLIIHGVNSGDPFRIIGFCIFGLSLTTLFLGSTLYHGVENSTLQKIFRRLDHSAIFLLIAGTYTPVILISIRTIEGYSMLAIVWLLSIIGISQKIFWFGKWKKWTIIPYLIMGWMALILIKPMLVAIPLSAFILLLTGGIVYSVGALFYSWESLKYHHTIWHLFVLTGSSLHYSAMYLL